MLTKELESDHQKLDSLESRVDEPKRHIQLKYRFQISGVNRRIIAHRPEFLCHKSDKLRMIYKLFPQIAAGLTR